jgi:hypothetical protein
VAIAAAAAVALADARVQDGFQPLRCAEGIGKHQLAHLRAVERAVRRGKAGPNSAQDGRHGRARAAR